MLFRRFLCKILRRSSIVYISVQNKDRELKFLQELDKSVKSCVLSFGNNSIDSFKIINSKHSTKKYKFFVCIKMVF